MISYIVCSTCSVPYDMITMGVWAIKLREGDDVAVYRGDRYQCPRCSNVVVADFGKAITRESIGQSQYVNTVAAVLQEEHITFSDA